MPTYLRAHSLITVFGDAWNQQEIWQFGLRLDGTQQPTLAQMISMSQAAATFIGAQGTSCHQAVRYLGLKHSPIGTDGKYPPSALSTIRFSNNAVPGVGPAASGAPQTSLVVSLRTAIPRGRGSNGRFYPPAIAMLTEPNTGRVPLAAQQALLGTAQTFINAINAVGIGRVSVFSQGNTATNPGPGLVNAVTELRVGGRMDIQRSRANKIPEAYVAGAVAPPP